MNWRTISPYLLWYSVVAAGVTMAALHPVSGWAGVDYGLVAVVATVGSLIVAPLLVGTTDTGIEAASASAEAGFAVENPMTLQPDTLPVPGRAALVFYLTGLAGYGAVVLVLVG